MDIWYFALQIISVVFFGQLTNASSKMSQNANSITLDLFNTTIKGLSNTIAYHISLNPDGLELALGLNMTNITADGSYNLQGTTISIPVSNTGKFRANITDVYLLGTVQMKVSNNGQLNIQDIQLNCVVQSISVQFENLFGLITNFILLFLALTFAVSISIIFIFFIFYRIFAFSNKCSNTIQ